MHTQHTQAGHNRQCWCVRTPAAVVGEGRQDRLLVHTVVRRLGAHLPGRIFALVKTMFGEEALNALSDYIEVALMLRYAERTVG